MTCDPAKFTPLRERTLHAAAVAWPRVLVLIIVCATRADRQQVRKRRKLADIRASGVRGARERPGAPAESESAPRTCV